MANFKMLPYIGPILLYLLASGKLIQSGFHFHDPFYHHYHHHHLHGPPFVLHSSQPSNDMNGTTTIPVQNHEYWTPHQPWRHGHYYTTHPYYGPPGFAPPAPGGTNNSGTAAAAPNPAPARFQELVPGQVNNITVGADFDPILFREYLISYLVRNYNPPNGTFNGWHNKPPSPYTQADFGWGSPNSTNSGMMGTDMPPGPPARENPSFIGMMEQLIARNNNTGNDTEADNNNSTTTVNLTRETEDERNGNFMDMIRTQVESLFRAFVPNRNIRGGNLTAEENNFRRLLRQRYQLRNSLFRDDNNSV